MTHHLKEVGVFSIEMKSGVLTEGDVMDQTGRKITKIAREVAKFTVQTMKEEGIGTAEFDFIHLVRHNPGKIELRR